MIRTLYRNGQGELLQDVLPDQFDTILRDNTGILWVDFEGEPPDRCEPILRGTFGFHPLAVDDALQESHVPKLDDWGQYLYLVLHAVIFDSQNGEHLDTLELDVFLGGNYMVTHHDQPIAALQRTWAACQRDARHWTRGVDHLLYLVSDELANSYMDAFNAMDVAIDQIEDELFDHPGPSVLERLFTIKRALLTLRRVLAPQREVLNKLARDEYAVIDRRDQIFFRDVYDHMVRLYDINESMRDLVGGALDTYLSVVNNRLNDVMKTLTVITTLFMPISFVAGFFGMNFFQPSVPLDVWTSLPIFLLTLAVCLLIPVGMSLWMRRRRWM